MENHQADRAQRDATRKAAWETSARTDGVNRSLQAAGGTKGKSTLAERAKYQFEADSEDDEMENEIDSNLGKSWLLMELPTILIPSRCASWCG